VSPAEPDADLERGLAVLLTASDDAAGPVTVEHLRRLSGGASRETWAFEAVTGDGTRRPLVLQRTRPGISSMDGPSMAVEDRLLTAAEAAGVPVPPVVADVVTATPVIGEARICGFVDGEALGPRIVRDDRYATARSRFADQCGRALAAVHAIDPADTPGLEPVDPLPRLRAGLDLVDEARPALELALRWLEDHRPPPGPVRVVHGDFRMGNLLVDEEGLTAVLDWELAHLGDPLEDLGWLCVRAWRFGGDGEVGGVGDLDDLLAAYGDTAGTTVDPEAVRWWIVAGTLTWGLISAVQARRHLDGHVRSVELATIGRRVCETEYDLLQLLGAPEPDRSSAATGGAGADAAESATGDPATGAPTTGERVTGERVTAEGAGLHGRPTALELVEAVRAHLRDTVGPELTGAAAFQTKVAANALAIVARELDHGRAPAVEAADRLAGLGVADERALAAGIRDRSVDPDPDVLAVVRSLVVERLQVANPRWLQGPDRADAADGV
jgi:aminoglycoside phosphotransferase (APT) family kinase protein